MKKRGHRLGSRLGAGLASRGLVFSLGLGLSGLLACGSDSDAGGEGARADGASAQEPPTVEVEPAEGAPVSSGRYQFVETPEGMTVEALRADAVQTLSCGVRSCLGLCDECALAACRAAGDLESVCAALVASCSDTCNCDSGGPGCGFPVCAFDRQLCYIGDLGASPGDGPAGDGPAGPNPDPSPEVDPASNPSGSGASQPAPVP